MSRFIEFVIQALLRDIQESIYIPQTLAMSISNSSPKMLQIVSFIDLSSFGS